VILRSGELLTAAPIIDGHNDFAFAMRTLVGYDLDSVDITS